MELVRSGYIIMLRRKSRKKAPTYDLVNRETDIHTWLHYTWFTLQTVPIAGYYLSFIGIVRFTLPHIRVGGGGGFGSHLLQWNTSLRIFKCCFFLLLFGHKFFLSVKHFCRASYFFPLYWTYEYEVHASSQYNWHNFVTTRYPLFIISIILSEGLPKGLILN